MSDRTGQDEQPDLTPETRAAMRRTALGRGMRRVREMGPDRFWEQQRRGAPVVGWGGGLLAYWIVVRLVPVPLIRQILGLVIGLYAGFSAMALWIPLYGFARVWLLGLHTGPDQEAQ